MKKVINIGNQDFRDILEHGDFYIDKTKFIKEWWENRDTVTLIARPRRFGKTLTISMLDYFFSNQYAGDGKIFEALSIWEDEKFRALQGTYPVISLSFSDIKENNFEESIKKIKLLIADIYNKNDFLIESGTLNEWEIKQFKENCEKNMDNVTLSVSIRFLSECLCRYCGKKVVILLDEYDTPLQEAYVNGYWDEMSGFIRGLFNSTLKANTYLERGLLTGITRVSKESIFSDLNNLEVITISSEKYAACFGFTQKEVDEALDYYELSDQSLEVQRWYNGFLFGAGTVIYNPWSMINYLNKKVFKPYWANTSSNSLIGKLIKQGDEDIKDQLLELLKGDCITATVDEQVVFNQLDNNDETIWSLMLATGYLKIIEITDYDEYKLKLTNFEVMLMFKSMISSWFKPEKRNYNGFMKALLVGDIKEMNAYMNQVALNTISYFDSGKRPSDDGEPERFYHGFVLGLMVDLEDQYTILSNRESGFGRYDIMLEPKSPEHDGIIIEFKVIDKTEEKDLVETAKAALLQIEAKKYEAALTVKGVKKVRKYGFAFEGKNVLIAEANLADSQA